MAESHFKDIFGESDSSDDEAEKKTGGGKAGGEELENLFNLDDDSDDDSDDGARKPAASRLKKAPAASSKPKKKSSAPTKRSRPAEDDAPKRKKKKKDAGAMPSAADKGKKKAAADESGDEYDSGGEVERTAADDSFIDNEDDDDDLLKEYAQDKQNFDDDERPEGHEKQKKKKGRGEEEDDDGGDDEDDDDPYNRTIKYIQGSGRRTKDMSSEDKDRLVQELLYQMDRHARDDAECVRKGKPALNKLKLLPVISKTLKNRSLHQPLLEFEGLNALNLWLKPTASGALPSLSLRTQLLEVLALLPVQPEHLKTSGLGKSVMTMLRHPDETQENKLAAKRLVEQWSRPIIGRSIDLRAHEKRHDSGPRDVVAEMRDRQGKDNMDECVETAGRRQPQLNQGTRVRIPEHRGFNFAARPAARAVDEASRLKFAREKLNPDSKKGKLNKRMLEMNRPFRKNERSVDMSIEGRGQHKVNK